MENPLKNIFRKDPPKNDDDKNEYTGNTKLTVDATGAVVSEELAEEDKRFDEEHQ